MYFKIVIGRSARKFGFWILFVVEIGSQAPDFSLPAVDGQDWHLRDHLGRVVALLFYPGNETLVCTKQLCSVRDNWERYVSTRAEIVGISPGTLEEHLTFSSRHALPLNLLADDNRAVTREFVKHTVWPIWATRGIVVIDAKGIVRFRDVMLRAFRPTDDDVLAEIHLAQYDKVTKN